MEVLFSLGVHAFFAAAALSVGALEAKAPNVRRARIATRTMLI
jgi:hypothetical protein